MYIFTTILIKFIHYQKKILRKDGQDQKMFSPSSATIRNAVTK